MNEKGDVSRKTYSGVDVQMHPRRERVIQGTEEELI